MPGGNNRSYALNKPANSTYRILLKHLLPFFTTIYQNIKCQEIFILGHFNKDIFKGHSLCIFFLHCQLKSKLKKSHPNAVTKSSTYRSNVNVTTLSQWAEVFRAEAEQLALFRSILTCRQNRCEWRQLYNWLWKNHEIYRCKWFHLLFRNHQNID